MDIFQKTVKTFPKFFELPLDSDSCGACIFESIKEIISFDEGFIFFLNPDGLELKYKYSKNNVFTNNKFFKFNNEFNLFNQESLILDNNSNLINLLNLETNQSFIAAKLFIRKTVFGLVLLCKNEPNFYNDEDLKVTEALCTIISYKIKDSELSNIFKLQLKALKENFTQIKDAYKTIEAQNKKILEADKVKNEFLANISHELRTPLNAIIGFSEILNNGFYGKLTDKQSEFVKDINISGIHLLGMINEILDISKLEACAMSLNLSEFNILMLVEEVLNIVKPLADKKNINLVKHVSADFKIYADYQKIKQILYNLLSNAIKFSPNNDEISTSIKQINNTLCLSVKDNGIGIDKKDQTKIFEKFVQLENAYIKKESSTGLGLTITKEFVEMHNGKISIKSALNKGAIFTIKIPIKTPEEIINN